MDSCPCSKIWWPGTFAPDARCTAAGCAQTIKIRMTTSLKTLALAFLAALTWSVQAQMPQPPEVAAKAYLLIDVTANQVLAAKDPDMAVEPASLTKLMTAYLVFDALKSRKIDLKQRPATLQWPALLALHLANGADTPQAHAHLSPSTSDFDRSEPEPFFEGSTTSAQALSRGRLCACRQAAAQ